MAESVACSALHCMAGGDGSIPSPGRHLLTLLKPLIGPCGWFHIPNKGRGRELDNSEF